MRRSLNIAIAALVLAAGTLSSCGRPDHSAHRTAPQSAATTPREVLDRARVLTGSHDTGAYRALVMSGRSDVLVASVQYSRRQAFSSAILQDTGTDFATLEMFRLHGMDYFSEEADCFFPLDYYGSPDVEAQFHFELQTPERLLEKAQAVSYDPADRLLRVRIPAAEAALLIGVEFRGALGRVLLDLLPGAVPAQLSLDNDGEPARLYVDGDDVVPVLRQVTSVPVKVIRAAAEDNGTVAIQAEPSSVDIPSADQRKESRDECRTTGA